MTRRGSQLTTAMADPISGHPDSSMHMFASDLFSLGRKYHENRRWEEAVHYYRQALERKTDFPQAHYYLALVFHEIGQKGEAEAEYLNALSLNPLYAEALNNLGQIYLERGDYHQALPLLQKAARSKSGFAEPNINLAELYRLNRCWDQAAACYREAIQVNPTNAGAWTNLGNTLRELKNPAGAAECFRAAIRLRPDFPEAHYNLGSVLKDGEEWSRAVEHLRIALQLQPNYPEAWNNLGLIYKNHAHYEQAIECFSNALEFRPDLTEAHWNRSSVLLTLGRLAEGFSDYEWRYRLPQQSQLYPVRHASPLWNGRLDRSITVLVHDEQGLGDTIQFIRYLPWLKDRCGKVILETQGDLIGLLKECPAVDAVVPRPETDVSAVDADYHVPLLSLPHLSGTEMDTIPAVVPYIWADLNKANRWRKRLEHASGLCVGIVWAGRPQHQNDRNRSCRLECFSALARIKGIRWFSLQKGPAAAQINEHGFQTTIEDLGDDLVDFTDTAAVIANLDLVISVDTSVAHLAGAMAKPVWVLLPFIPDWRWLLDREDSPWYPTMRLFRQDCSESWVGVFQRVEDALLQAIHSFSGTASGVTDSDFKCGL